MLLKHEQGFTLVEISIVLIIIGLLLGGVLKGQEIIGNAKVRNAINDLNGVAAAVGAYTDRYDRRLPGDDAPNTRGAIWSTLLQGDNDGLIGSVAQDPFAGTGESIGFWQHLRAAGLITGNASAVGVAGLPKNAWNGVTGVTNGVYGLSNVVCMRNVTGNAALALDNQLDDGRPQTGAIRATGGTSVPSVIPTAAIPTDAIYAEENFYSVCRSL